ncbi:hypothetical protein [Roseococcus pinisoli]|uniref:Glycosyl transferase family 2 n=1 Tax=Roseococcus pinisoli TaxID=2835040 RepID=A0ABS5Q991_9PROT|nr:hypothetical protein [Roseococcus pinisoli]MBS7810274.1 hypothetical protein [Roseococcus pinisoli]
MTGIDLSVVLAVGREAAALHATLFALRRAAGALAPGIGIEVLLLHDPDTSDLAARFAGDMDAMCLRPLALIDPLDAQRHAVASARGRYLAFLTAGDLCSGNLLTEAMCVIGREDLRHSVWRPEVIVSCGRNYFDLALDTVLQEPMLNQAAGAGLLQSCPYATCFFAHRAVYQRVPFPMADARRDWLDVDAWWIANCLGAGIAQRILAGTALYRWNAEQPLPYATRIGPSTLFNPYVMP